MSDQHAPTAGVRVVLQERRRFVREALAALLERHGHAVDACEQLDDLAVLLRERTYDVAVVGDRVDATTIAALGTRVVRVDDAARAADVLRRVAGGAATTDGGSDADGGTPLSVRELEVLTAVARGLTATAISAAMGISAKTVAHHKASIFEKLQVQNQSHAVAVALRDGLISRVDLDVDAVLVGRRDG